MRNEKKEFLKSFDWMPGWDSNAPKPQVYSNTENTYVLYLVDKDAVEDIEIKELAPAENEKKQLIALTTFTGATYRFGFASDAIFGGVPYDFDDVHWAHQVINSRWLMQLTEIHKKRHNKDTTFWDNRNHLILLLKNQLFEIIYLDYKAEVFHSSFQTVGNEVLRRMNSEKQTIFIDSYS